MSPPRGLVAFGGLWALVLAVPWAWQGLGPSMALGWLTTTGPSVAAALALIAACWGPGAIVARALQGRPLRDPSAQALIEIALGLSIAVAVSSLLAFVGQLRPAVGPAAIVVGLAAGAMQLRERRPGALTAPGSLTLVAGVGAAALLLPTLLSAGAPPTGADELQYHLRLPVRLLELGAVPDPHDPTSAFPRGLHALLALVVGFAGEGAARPLCLGLGLLGIGAAWRAGVRIGGPTAGAFTLVIAAGAASVVRSLPTVNNDATLALFVGAAVLVALDVDEDAGLDVRTGVLLGLLGGAAFSLKYTAAIYIGPVVVAAGLVGAGRIRGRLPGLLLAALLPVLFAAPWLAANASAGLHPLFPLRGLAVPEGLQAAFRFNHTENYGAGAGWLAWLRTPWDLFVLGAEFDRRHFLGRLAPWPLLALPGVVLALRNRHARQLALVVALGFAAWAGPLRRVAYLLPLWPLIAALCGVGIATLVRGRGALATGALLGVLVVGAIEVAPGWVAGTDDAAVAAGRASWDATIDARVESAPAWRWVQENAEEGDVVVTAFVWQVLAPDQRVLWACAEECPDVRLRLRDAGSGAVAAERLKAEGARWLLVRERPPVRDGHPGLSEEVFEQAYVDPHRVLQELTSLHARERFRAGLYAVYELD